MDSLPGSLASELVVLLVRPKTDEADKRDCRTFTLGIVVTSELAAWRMKQKDDGEALSIVCFTQYSERKYEDLHKE